MEVQRGQAIALEQKIFMWFLSHNIPKRNKLVENISQKNPEYMFNCSLQLKFEFILICNKAEIDN
jgi:hypothetical protein